MWAPVLGNHSIAPLVACTRTHFGVQERCTGQVLSTSDDTVRPSCLSLTILDIQERFVLISSISTFCNWIPHSVLNQMPLSMFGTNCPSLDNRPGATTLYACHTLVFCDASSFSLSPSCWASANVYELSPLILRE